MLVDGIMNYAVTQSENPQDNKWLINWVLLVLTLTN